MKTDRNLVEGQLDIFEAMDRAAAAVDRMVAEETGSRGKAATKKSAGKKQEGKTAEALKQPSGHKITDVIRGSDMHASMQRTFLNPADGDFATVAYVDYHMVYFRDWNSPASLKRFEDAKAAVEYYFRQMEKIRQLPGVEQTAEHEPFLDVRYVAENIYAECS